MKSLLIVATMLGTGIGIVGLIGCNDDHRDGMMNNDGAVTILRVTPQDGATDVSTATTVTVTFSGRVDSLSVMSNFHLTGGDVMHEWYDSLAHYGGFGMMGMHERYHMMEWMDTIHLSGQFRWNTTVDSCAFTPDGLLDPGTDYLCLLYESGMRDHDGGMMGGMGHEDSGYHMFRFSTGPASAGAPRLLSVTPPDGATGVATTASVTLCFDVPMDTLSVMGNFHFSGGDDMQEWMDSLDHHAGMGGMGMVDMGHMMNWMDSIEQDGDFHWNGAMDTCLFTPDSAMMSHTEYMMYLNGDVHGHTGELMDMHHFEYDGHMVHFTTGP